MAIQYSTDLRNARSNQIQTIAGASPIFRFYTGTKPASLSDAVTGTLLAEITLPTVWLGTAGNGVVTQEGVWTTSSALATGTPGYFRIFKSDGVTPVMQGAIPVDLSGGSTPAITAGSAVTIGPGFTLTDGNA